MVGFSILCSSGGGRGSRRKRPIFHDERGRSKQIRPTFPEYVTSFFGPSNINKTMLARAVTKGKQMFMVSNFSVLQTTLRFSPLERNRRREAWEKHFAGLRFSKMKWAYRRGSLFFATTASISFTAQDGVFFIWREAAARGGGEKAHLSCSRSRAIASLMICLCLSNAVMLLTEEKPLLVISPRFFILH